MATTFPYQKTSVLSSAAGDTNITYILRPTKSFTYNLVSVRTNSTLSSSNLSQDTSLYTSIELPSSVANEHSSLTPILDAEGDLFVLSGQCDQTADTTELWLLGTDGGEVERWEKQNISYDKDSRSSADTGVMSLAASMTFASRVNGTSSLYIFGGMCPNATGLGVENWQYSATYTSNMLVIEKNLSTTSTSSSKSDYDISTIGSRGAPIAEAGLTITPLQPTFFPESSGDSSQQQNFVLIGGHTQQAFLNMSQVALFSLPEKSWAFIPVASSPEVGKTDLTVRNTSEIDPRSGHSAVLTTDGRQIVVFGGWVGDVSTPAEPPLLILNLGSGYGGDGDWQWTVPKITESNDLPPIQAGLYGHGATMLEGDVMMITGGYVVSNTSISKRDEPGQDIFFYNITAGTWSTEYTNPSYLLQQQSRADTHDNTTTRRVGLGVGLGLGLSLLVFLAVLFCLLQRARWRRAARHRNLTDLDNFSRGNVVVPTGTGYTDAAGQDRASMTSMVQKRHGEEVFPWLARGNSDSSVAGTMKRAGNTEAERTGLLVEVPSPTRGLRRSLYSRANSHSPTWYDESRLNRISGIHTIDETCEDEDQPEYARQTLTSDMGVQQNPVLAFQNVPVLDPFVDPLGSHPPFPSRRPPRETPAEQREEEVRRWVEDWSVAERVMYQQAQSAGRLSPDKSDRTSSTLSDRSMHSAVSALSMQPSTTGNTGPISRTTSQRSSLTAPYLTSNPFATNNNSPTSPSFDIANAAISQVGGNQTTASSARDPLDRRARSLTIDGMNSATQFAETLHTTAPRSFDQLRAESEALLGGSAANAGVSRHSGFFIPPGRSSPTQSVDLQPGGLPTRQRPINMGRARNWMGSVKRALGGERRGSLTAAVTPGDGEVRFTFDRHIEHRGLDSLPRRAASTGGILWATRQGARDWNVERGDELVRGRTELFGNVSDAEQSTSPARNGGGRSSNGEVDEPDWDVESAVERRVVQVMFTVPREKLRVVNAGPGDGDSRSLRSLSGEVVEAQDMQRDVQRSREALHADFVAESEEREIREGHESQDSTESFLDVEEY